MYIFTHKENEELADYSITSSSPISHKTPMS